MTEFADRLKEILEQHADHRSISSRRELLDRATSLFSLVLSAMGVERTDALNMNSAELNALFEKAGNELCKDVLGVKMTFEVTRPTAVRNLFYMGRSSLLTYLPQEMKDVFSTAMDNKFAAVGARLIDVEYKGYNFAPKVTWEYQDKQYQAFFTLDGYFREGHNWDFDNPADHTFESIVCIVAPERSP